MNMVDVMQKRYTDDKNIQALISGLIILVPHTLWPNNHIILHKLLSR
jgi:hypothetical protein